jgi:cytochrome P450
MSAYAERATLGEIGHRLGRKVLAEVATIARPDTILAWYRKLVARGFSGSQARQGPGRPRLKREVVRWIRASWTSAPQLAVAIVGAVLDLPRQTAPVRIHAEDLVDT